MTLTDIPSLRDIEFGMSLAMERIKMNLEKEKDPDMREYYFKRLENMQHIIMYANRELHLQFQSEPKTTGDL